MVATVKYKQDYTDLNPDVTLLAQQRLHANVLDLPIQSKLVSGQQVDEAAD
jgi:hypothetical protein